MNPPSSPAGGVVEWEDSAGEMESEDNHAATVAGMDDAHDPADADFFNSFPDDFDDHDLC